MRLFVGISLPENLVHDLHEETIPLRMDKTWRSIHFENWHVTTCFIGDFNGDIDILIDKIKDLTKSTESFDLEFNRITTVSQKNPRMIWLKGKKNKHFSELVYGLNRSLLNKKPDHAPNPHITIARSRKEITPGIYQSEFNAKFKVTEIELFQSFLNPNGVNYKSLGKFELNNA